MVEKINIRGLCLVIVFALLGISPNVLAAGGDCTDAQARDLTGSDNLVNFNAPTGHTVYEVCVKSSTTHFKFYSDGSNGCYTISGIGSGSVSVERTGPQDSSCQEISHVDVYHGIITPSPTPSSTPVTTSTPTSSPSPTASASPESSPSPSPSPAVSPTPTSTPNPSSNHESSSSGSSGSSSGSSSSSEVGGTSATLTPAPISRVLGAVAQRLPETGVEIAGVITALASFATGTGLIAWRYRKSKKLGKN